ncbi:arylsulfatase [Gimesia maris]|uniref:Arylsulfatase n=1 Tax=Gimesia maris TaxID=122 RepID=A0ABX5YGF7_9PLAN|nr:arylsulfatase [Gimesia maris]EDL61799.1 N-acetylgalactosamine 6-sulfate sulfatase (GALNS) [Gimesia maris DSM 8797]QEG14817.1 Arylsulfatase precursor [Gimesia maris]QGQ31792.1 arylsulfatase [Gimesia maris]
MRPILHLLTFILILLVSLKDCPADTPDSGKPNIILVITDDQGYGDIAAHGNQMIKTPNLDQLYQKSLRLTNFHVDPTCAPTRSALMTGRYSTRTGVWHTIMGRSLMDTNEVTLAEVFKSNGYRTGLFGKWHLGDNYPLRPQDQGFGTVVQHGGGGVGQTPDDWQNDYFSDTYLRNGKPEKFQGYCTDIWFDEALKFIEADRTKPFFAYLSTNAPHSPYLVDPEYSDPYEDKGVPKKMAAFYGMITNIDENMGRLLRYLKESGLEKNTILIFMTDNGTAAGLQRPSTEDLSKKQQRRLSKGKPITLETWPGFNARMRGTKGSEYDGGHRVPCYIHWPQGGLTGGKNINQLTAHIDILPTLADLCDLTISSELKLDGTSLVPILTGNKDALRNRTLIVHSQRIESPEKWRKSSVMAERWRLVNEKELYDIQNDPGQTKNVAAEYAGVVKYLSAEYEKWWSSLTPVFSRYVAIGIGSRFENPSHLTCHDWHAPIEQVPWNHQLIAKNPVANGFWIVDVTEPGTYEITLRCRPESAHHPLKKGNARIQIGDVKREQAVSEGDLSTTFEVDLTRGQKKLQTWLDEGNGVTRGAFFVEIFRKEKK